MFEDGSSLKRMGKSVFLDCVSLRSIYLPEGLEEIGAYCFYRSGLEEFISPPGLREIGGAAFCGCESLRRVVLNEGLEVLTDYGCCGVFEGSKIEEITLPSTLRQIDSYTFDGCDRLQTVRVADGFQMDLLQFPIPSSARFDFPTAMAGNVCVQDLRQMREVVIPEGVERIGSCWFYGTEVESVTIPTSVREIGFQAFSGCEKLTKVTFQRRGASGKVFDSAAQARPLEITGGSASSDSLFDGDSQLRLVGNGAFSGCTSLKTVDLPDSVEEIGIDAFGFSGLESFTAPKVLRTVRQGAFAKCEHLKTVRFKEGLEALGTDEYLRKGTRIQLYRGVFEESALESVLLPQTLKRIEYNAFKNCKRLRTAVLPEKLECLGDQCFCGTDIAEIALPGALRKISKYTFFNCDCLRTIWVEEGCEAEVRQLAGDSVRVVVQHPGTE